ncbi:sirohydrochlorin chelatase [Actinomycetes bacterium NPDC127524]
MEAILYICHGSRVEKARMEAVSFIKECINQHPAAIQEYGFLELAEPSIEQAFSNCVKRGAKKVIVLPVLLLAAMHAKEDIPNELKRIQKRFPFIEIKYGAPIGVHDYMIDILKERIAETGETDIENSIVLLVGRGSSDPDVKRDLTSIAERLKIKTGFSAVEVCFLTAASPGLEEGLVMAGKSKYKNVLIIPYLLFTGILMKTIQKSISTLSRDAGKQFILCNYLGYHPRIGDILQQRAAELSEGASHVSSHA